MYIWFAPNIVGVFNGEGPPVPIPNTEVKLTSAENTCLATDWKDRSTPTQTPERNLEAVCVGVELSFQSVARQVLSPLVSLTSVFGMGTGGPSPLKTPTIQDIVP